MYVRIPFSIRRFSSRRDALRRYIRSAYTRTLDIPTTRLGTLDLLERLLRLWFDVEHDEGFQASGVGRAAVY